MGKQNRRKYDADFKRNAVLLSLRPDKAVQEVADDLGIHKDLIYQWRKQYDQHGELDFPGNGILIHTKVKPFSILKFPSFRGVDAKQTGCFFYLFY